MKEIVFYIFCFFPFISLTGNSSHDVQPYCLVYTIFLFAIECVCGGIRVNKTMRNLYLTIILGIVMGMLVTIILNGFNFSGVLRYLATYCGLILISYMSYTICVKNNGLDEKLIKACINIWLIVGMIQLFMPGEVISAIVANARTSNNRGVVSMASEPSFYGYMCIFLGLFVLEFSSQRVIYMINLLFQIIFLAKSSVTMLYLIILFGLIGLHFIGKASIKKKLMSVSVLCCTVWGVGELIRHIDSNQRMVIFLTVLYSGNDFFTIISQLGMDGSISIRFYNVWICIQGFISYVGFPHGFRTGKIQSGYGSMLYTMGWIGAIIIFLIYQLVGSAYRNKMAKSVIPVFLTIILFSAIQLSNPVIGFLIGFYMYKRQNQFARKLDKLIIKYSKSFKLRE